MHQNLISNSRQAGQQALCLAQAVSDQYRRFAFLFVFVIQSWMLLKISCCGFQL
jgi:hypothetical protein